MFPDLSLREFLELLSSDSPTPGGGSASCVAGAYGIGLIAMSFAVSSKKAKVEISEVESFLETLRRDAKNLLSMADDDTFAFNEVMEAYRLPKDTTEQKEERRKAIEEALKHATLVPLSLLKTISKITDSLEYAYKILSINVASDYISGLCLIQSALYGGYANVLINILSIKDEEFKNNIKHEADSIFVALKEKLKTMQDEAMNKINLEG